MDGEEFDSLEDYFAVMEARQSYRASFSDPAEALVDEFIDHMYDQGLPEHQIRQYGQDVDMLVYYLIQHTDENDFATMRHRVVGRDFYRWYSSTAWGRSDQDALKHSVKKFFEFLAQEKGIYNTYVLGKRK